VKDIPPSLRNNVDFLFIKRMKYMYDVYIALNYMLVLLKYLFWRTMARIKAMGPEEFFMVDRAGNWDFYQIPNLPEEPPKYGVIQQLDMSEELNPRPLRGRERHEYGYRLLKAVKLRQEGLTWDEIGHELGVDPTWLWRTVTAACKGDQELIEWARAKGRLRKLVATCH